MKTDGAPSPARRHLSYGESRRRIPRAEELSGDRLRKRGDFMLKWLVTLAFCSMAFAPAIADTVSPSTSRPIISPGTRGLSDRPPMTAVPGRPQAVRVNLTLFPRLYHKCTPAPGLTIFECSSASEDAYCPDGSLERVNIAGEEYHCRVACPSEPSTDGGIPFCECSYETENCTLAQ